MYLYVCVLLYSRQCRLEAEIRSTRLTKEELNQLEQEQLKKEAEGRKMRSEQARIKLEEMKQREIENVSILGVV